MPLRNARYLEQMNPVLLSLNRFFYLLRLDQPSMEALASSDSQNLGFKVVK